MPNEFIIQEGDEGRAFFFILTGEVSLGIVKLTMKRFCESEDFLRFAIFLTISFPYVKAQSSKSGRVPGKQA